MIPPPRTTAERVANARQTEREALLQEISATEAVEQIVLDRPAIEATLLFTLLVCREERLTIGAITSPGLSNAVLMPLDQVLARRCGEMEITYTRYADDMYFSTRMPNLLRDVPALVQESLGAIPYPAALAMNASKTRHSSLKKQRRVTGLILSTQGGVSLGRHFKRGVRSC